MIKWARRGEEKGRVGNRARKKEVVDCLPLCKRGLVGKKVRRVGRLSRGRSSGESFVVLQPEKKGRPAANVVCAAYLPTVRISACDLGSLTYYGPPILALPGYGF